MSDYYIDDKEDDEIEESKEYASVRDNIVFLVDVRQPMLERPGDPIEGFEEEDTWFSICMKCMKNIMKSSIIGSPTDQMAVILYGTRESKNENNFDHVYVLQDLKEGSARRLKELDEIIKGGKFEETIGSATDGSSAEDLKFGLWAANNQILRTPGSTHRSVDIMTNELRPDATSAGGIQEDERDAIMTRVEALRDSKAAISLTPMVPTGQKSEPSEFWETLLQLNPDSDEGYAPDENQLRSLRSLATVVRYRSAKKRPLRTTMLQLGPHFSIAVKLFKMLAKAGPAKKVQVYSVTNEEIITENMLTNSDTGHALTKAMLTQVCFPKDPKHELLFPRVVFTTEEAANIKRLQPEGIHLMGFKPLKYLRDHYNMKPPTFVYPTDEDLKGSSTAFRALHNGMLSTGYFAVASAVLGQGSAPQMVALLAQEEIIDDDNDQVAPPGIQMIPLPWSDDIRYPERDPTFVGTRHTFATDAQVDAAEKMLDAMQLPDDFCSSDINDPHLQRHFQVLENLALGETPVAQAPDMTLPCVNPDIKDIISKAEPCIRAFSECTVVVSAPGTTGGIKRKAADVAISEEDWKKAAANIMLDSMTIPQLKEYCDAHNLKKGGKKGDLVDRVYEHIKQ